MRRAILAISLLLAALAWAAPASASTAQILRDCELHGRLTGHYTQKELRDALAHLPSDVNEYSDCANVIRTAALSAASGGGTNGGSGGQNGGTSGGTAPGSAGGQSGGTGSTGGGGSAPSGSGSSGHGGSTGGEDRTSSTGGDFGGFQDYPKDPQRNASASDRAAIARARHSTGAQTVGGVPVVPGTVGSHAGSPDLPAPLIAVLALAAAALLTLAALEIRRHVRARGTGDTA